MKEDEIYIDLAKRFIESSDSGYSSANPKLEIVGFECYHAYESLAGGCVAYYGRKVPKQHPKKLNAFLAVSKSAKFLDERAVAQINMIFEHQRNRFLYPDKVASGVITHPKDVMTSSDLGKYIRKIKGIISKADSII